MLEINRSDNIISIHINGKQISRFFADDKFADTYDEILNLLKTLHIELKEMNPVPLYKAHPEGHAQKVG
jgi:dsDNA-binding SOS-regulon protein